MIKYFSILAFSALAYCVNAQTWSGGVAQLFYNKCTQCHHQGGAAPSSLMTYQEVSPMVNAVAAAVGQDRMPPWPPDNNYQTYLHTRSLSSGEKSLLLSWIAASAPEGNAAATPPPPVYTNNTFLGNGDLIVQMPNYLSKATAFADDYVCFSIPTNLTQNRILKAVEVVPGNRDIVHHALVYLDDAGAEQTDTIGGNCASPSNQNTKLIMGYTPGAGPLILPSVSPLKMGINIAAGAKIYLNMHYPEGSFGMMDSTKVILHFYPVGTTGVRQVYAAPVLADYAFALPPNQMTTLSAQYPNGTAGVPIDLSVISVFPHMHLLGHDIKAYATGPANDTLKFINIPRWDFHWQDFYFFDHLKHLPTGYTIKGKGVYDNTDQNIHNPNTPPQTVYVGYNTTDEMFIIYFHYMYYLPGDENYDLATLMNASLEEYGNSSAIKSYPNPMGDNGLNIVFEGGFDPEIKVLVYDLKGTLVNTLSQEDAINPTTIFWKGDNQNGAESTAGMYYLSINNKGKMSTTKIIKR